MFRDHGHGDGLPERPTEAQDGRPEDAQRTQGKGHPASHFPFGHSEGGGTFLRQTRDLEQEVAGGGGDDRDDHEGQDESQASNPSPCPVGGRQYRRMGTTSEMWSATIG